jgi:hypothetical protein
MSAKTEKTPTPTSEENQLVFTHQFKAKNPSEYSQRLQRCWITMLSNLDHSENGLLTQADIQHLSEHFILLSFFAENCQE